MKITAPAKVTGSTRIGPTVLAFNDGVAEVNDLPPGVLAYLKRRGYKVGSVRAASSEKPDDGKGGDAT